MGERSIIMSGASVRAILAGTKSQHREVMTTLKGCGRISEFGHSNTRGYDCHFRDAGKRWHDISHARLLELLPYAIGQRLWVRETWWHPEPYSYGTLPSGDEMQCPKMVNPHAPVHFAADGDPLSTPNRTYPDGFREGSRLFAAPDPWAIWTKRSSTTMPRWASRLTLTVTDVRVQRLGEISCADAIAEGIPPGANSATIDSDTPDPRHAYHHLWNSLHGPSAWNENPWVAAISFRADPRNIDADRGRDSDGAAR